MNPITANDPIERGVATPHVVVTATGSNRGPALALAHALGLAFHDSAPAAGTLRLVQTDATLELRDTATGARLCVQFSAAQLRRYRAGAGALRRAIGPGRRHVVDATAGFGSDAVHIAALGHRVTAIERNAVVFALTHDGMKRARAQGVLSPDNPRLLDGDARVLLPQIDVRAATVYLDPMFPPKRKKSAAVRKEMDLLRRLAIDDADALDLLATARACAGERVVVKRPIDAPPLAPGAFAAYAGKLVRYDVYRPRDRAP